MFFRLQRGSASAYRSLQTLSACFTAPHFIPKPTFQPALSTSKAGRCTSPRRMFALYAPRPNQPKTLAHQSTLPRLPVPKLSDSLAKYLKSLKPILYEQARLSKHEDPDAFVSAELGKRQEWIQDFDSISGLGRTLQERLVDADRAAPNNWLDDTYWLNVAYHSWRVPLPINSNWWLLCAHDADVPKSVTESRPPHGEYTNWQVRRAAVMAVRLMDFKERLDRQELLTDSSRAGPFCMHQYTRVFGVTRVPAVPNDHFKHSPTVNPNSHAIVIVKDQLFSLNMKDHNGKVKTKDDIEKALWLIIKDVRIGNTERSLPIGVLTGANRDSWTKIREHLLSLSPKNRANLSVIEDGLFVLALEDYTRIHHGAHISSLASELIPQSQAGLQTPSAGVEPDASLELDGHVLNSCSGLNGHNRWFDKCMTINVENNSRASVMGEHSPCDALIPSIIADYVLAEGMGRPRGPPKTLDQAGNDAGPDKATVESVEKDVQRLTWVTDAKVSEAIDEAEKEIKAAVEDSEGLMLWFDDYGTEWIKKVGKQSPDAYIQMAMQLAYRRMHGHGCPTYETASTRLFLHGRTDVIRTYSEDSQRWVEAMVAASGEGSQSIMQDATKLYDLLAKAITAHNTFTREASTGKGFDRHLLGLRLNMQKGESHPLLEDPLFAESQSWKLSTSGLSAGDRFYGTGFGATDPDGYGINYLAGAKIIKFGIESKWSSKVSSTHKFRLAIVEAMRDMRKICEHGQETSPSSTDATRNKL